MGFLKKLFGGKDKPYVDENGIYFYVRCQNCGTVVRVRADRRNDLSHADGGYEWHKTIVDNKCFRRMETVVQFNHKYEVTHADLRGGDYVTEAEYDAWLNRPTHSEAETTETADSSPD
ncbi:MAG: hypothetical protein KC425_17150 [Anaerolineales bacterium]|nr:hypothetical protein [Anaerolineales bacterium]